MHVGMSELFREHNDLDSALKHLRASADLGEHAGLPQNRYRSRVAMARIRRSEGDLDGALDQLSEAERLYVSDYFPNVRPIPAMKARVLVAQGNLARALGWARERGLSVEDDVSYLREYEHITLARVLLARHATISGEDSGSSLDEVTRFLERLLHAAERGGRTASVIEILVLHALAHQARCDIPAALTSLQRALTLAEPEDYVRLFVDEGPPMLSLLRTGLDQDVVPEYVRRLLAAAEPTVEPAMESTVEPTVEAAGPRQLVEPLSRRERDVVRLLATDLDGPAIARELFISLNTLRSHTKSIYAKLGVTSRRAAVRRAQELDVASRARD
jgi:LuxR family maltose regulon positive regulatory protein